MAEAFTKSDVEILISTMDRHSLDFLGPMFPFTHFSNFNILIVNQTKEGVVLVSEHPNVRVINSFERGLSKSRNLAITNSVHKIGLIADDDLMFVEGFDKRVAQGFNRFSNAAAVKFITTTFEGQPFRKYPKQPIKNINALQRLNSTSWEIALQMSKVKESGIEFDTNFGLGTSLPLGEEIILINDLHKEGFQISFEPEIIVTHKAIKDSDNISIELNCTTRGAYLTRIFGWQFPFWISLQFLFFIKHRKIKSKEVLSCLKYALKGRKHALAIEKQKISRK